MSGTVTVTVGEQFWDELIDSLDRASSVIYQEYSGTHGREWKLHLDIEATVETLKGLAVERRPSR